ncbi:DNA -binding domain-containing protein [Algihabitans albus]|uniref:DNA -binding domain-containing protein n=1 Tax=Algihabitans albus TaxID=2164067 RepID=UPI000E5D50FA|nr:DUF2285 domain-containing protein [Algihabitans albus]
MTRSPDATIAEAPPTGEALTPYDREHIKLYMRLLDAERAGASWPEVARLLLGIDPEAEPERAQQVHQSHLGRARWMTEHGYRELLSSAG